MSPSLSGFAGLELVLHEASHTMFGSRFGTVADGIREVSEAQGEEPPRGLWHALSFYTSGEAVSRVAHAAGQKEFEPHAKRVGLFDEPYRGYLPAIERHWQPYLEGQVELRAALSALIAELSTPENGP